MSDTLPTTIDTTYFELDSEGRTQEVDMLSGEIIRRAESPLDLLENKYIEKASQAKPTIWKFHKVYGDIILNLIVNDKKTIGDIVKMEGMPSRSVIARWESQNEDFAKGLLLARKARAEAYADQIAEDGEDDHGSDKDDIQARKLKLDRLKWLAAKGDPDKFGDRTKVSGDSNAPLQIVVSTGIVRKPKEEA